LDLGELTRGRCSSRELRSHRSNRCLSLIWPVQTLSWVLLKWTSWRVPYCLMLLLIRVWFSLELGRLGWHIWDFHAQTGLTGELHQPDWCRGFSVGIAKSCSGDPAQDRGWPGASPAAESGRSNRDWSDWCRWPVSPVLVSSCSSWFSRCVLE
jgi:hypothetical protein